MTIATGENTNKTVVNIEAESAMLGKDILLIGAVNPGSEFLGTQVERLSDEIVSEALVTGELDLSKIQDGIEEIVESVTDDVLSILQEVRPTETEIQIAQGQRIAQLAFELEAEKQAHKDDVFAMNELYPNAGLIVRANEELQAELDGRKAQKRIDDGVIEMQAEIIRTHMQNNDFETPAAKVMEFSKNILVKLRKSGKATIKAFNNA